MLLVLRFLYRCSFHSSLPHKPNSGVLGIVLKIHKEICSCFRPPTVVDISTASQHSHARYFTTVKGIVKVKGEVVPMPSTTPLNNIRWVVVKLHAFLS